MCARLPACIPPSTRSLRGQPHACYPPSCLAAPSPLAAHATLAQEGVLPWASLAHVVQGSGMHWTWLLSAFSPLPLCLQLLCQAVVSAAAPAQPQAADALIESNAEPNAKAPLPWHVRLAACIPTCPCTRRCWLTAQPTSGATPAQLQVCVVLLSFSKRMCADSPGLRRGYRTIGCLLGWPQPDGWPLACLRRTREAPAATSAAVQACLRWQEGMLLLPGFVGATWAAFRSERRLRGAYPAANRRADLAQAMPSDLEFLLNFAIPTAMNMWLYAR